MNKVCLVVNNHTGSVVAVYDNASSASKDFVNPVHLPDYYRFVEMEVSKSKGRGEIVVIDSEESNSIIDSMLVIVLSVSIAICIMLTLPYLSKLF